MTVPEGMRVMEETRSRAPSAPAPSAAMPDAATVVWTFDPWSERPLAAGITALTVLAMWLVLALLALPAFYKLALGAALAAQLLPLIAPSVCRSDPTGLECRQLAMTSRLLWLQVSGVERLGGGVRVIRKRVPRWAAGLTALLLPMPRARRDELVRHVELEWSRRAG